MFLEVARGGDEVPGRAAKTPRDQRRVREHPGANGDVETLLDEVDRARRAEQLEADFGVALEKVADDGSEEFGVHRSGRAQESPRRLLQPAQRPLGLFDLSDDARA